MRVDSPALSTKKRDPRFCSQIRDLSKNGIGSRQYVMKYNGRTMVQWMSC